MTQRGPTEAEAKAAKILRQLPDGPLRHKSWSWFVEQKDNMVEVAFKGEGWPVGAVMVDITHNENSIRATIGYAIRSYELTMRNKHGPTPHDDEEAV